VRGVPFVAYDYISGKDLAALQEQARRRNHPIPSDHALLIAERIALALAVGYETRLDDDRVLHGCVLPQLVMISNEGETRLLGFEAAPGLRQVVRGAVATRPLARYLSPEARGGAAANKSDDVYSLGAILFELLTGGPVPADGDLGAAIDHAELSSEGMPLPEDLKRLLKQSLTTADKRLGDVISWHKQLSRMMFEGQYNPTTFNLAFFMHNLFRDEIEKESREIEVEKTMEIQLPAAAAAVAAAGAGAAAAAPPPVKAPTFGSVNADLRESTSTGVLSDTQARARQKSARTWPSSAPSRRWSSSALGVGGYFYFRGRGAATPATLNPAAAPSVAPRRPRRAAAAGRGAEGRGGAHRAAVQGAARQAEQGHAGALRRAARHHAQGDGRGEAARSAGAAGGRRPRAVEPAGAGRYGGVAVRAPGADAGGGTGAHHRGSATGRDHRRRPAAGTRAGRARAGAAHRRHHLAGGAQRLDAAEAARPAQPDLPGHRPAHAQGGDGRRSRARRRARPRAGGAAQGRRRRLRLRPVGPAGGARRALRSRDAGRAAGQDVGRPADPLQALSRVG
jgi:hypothetical protein